MKLSALLVFAFSLSTFASSYSQEAKVSLNLKGANLQKLFMEIEKQTDYKFVYGDDNIEGRAKITLDVKETSVSEVLKLALGDMPLVHELVNGYIVVIKPVDKNQDAILINGIVRDENGKGMPGVSIKSGKTISVTDRSGNYEIKVPDENAKITFTYIGYRAYTTSASAAKKTLNARLLFIKMEPDETALDAVVVTGITSRKKESFTGATTSFSRAQLREVGNQNIIQSLKTLDPSFVIVQNNLQGSNPNVAPSIEIRGKSSLNAANVADQFGQDPNQPLFILDGFESTLQVINDLDMNRVASVTILKDAASTAIYGAKAANGVVVVETLPPLPGKLRVSYTADLRVEVPDLDSYNLMNAAEKLEFERLSGRYTSINSPAFQFALNNQYHAKLAEVQRGVDSYWLSAPVRTGITNGHSVQLSGGSNELLFGAGLTYKSINGAMKGSERNTWGGNVDLSYRKGKVNISNRLNISGFDAADSPYGSFSNFTNANPYYRKYNAAGGIDKYLEQSYSSNVVSAPNYIVFNPLYNATLASFNTDKNLSIRENLRVIVDLSNLLRLESGFQVNRETLQVIDFLDPANTAFDNAGTYQKGSYSRTGTETMDYQANLMLTYANVFGKHQVTGNLRTDVQHNARRMTGFEALGFPSGTNGNPAFAYAYNTSKTPTAASSVYRRNNLLFSANYSYDMRYLLDMNYRIDGSTAFGSKHKYAPFWSAGLGWNLHRESFLKNAPWIDMLKLRANVGLTGNQNLGSLSSSSVYDYMAGSNIFGQGLSLSSLGNPDLEWQNTLQTSVGADITLLNNRVSAVINYYQKDTDPLVIGLTQASSVGTSSYAQNLGSLNTKGWELNLRYSPIYNLKDRIIWTIGIFGSKVKSIYGGLGNNLEGLNKIQLESNSLLRYQDGYSPDDIWAVVSRGIDPATGTEVFLKKDGQESLIYSADDIVKVGNVRPDLEGVITTNFTYKAFSLGLNVRYRIGGDLFNSALYSKVENISISGLRNNQDKRALYGRWQQIGDISSFKAISSTSTTPMSSRFVQKDNNFTGESINVGWQFREEKWLKRAHLQSLRLNVYMNDIFRMESVQSERGLSYPYAKTVSFGLNASF